MTSTTFFILFIPILAIILLLVNLVLAPHNPYQEKDSVFECGFHSFLGQNRTQFSISFFIFALLFLLFDLEILLIYPYSLSSYSNDIYGLSIMILFFILLTLGFMFELGKNALSIDSKQIITFKTTNVSNIDTFANSGLKSMFGPSSSSSNKRLGSDSPLNEVRRIQEELKLLSKAEDLDNKLSDKSKNNEMEGIIDHYESFFDEESGNTRQEGIQQLREYLQEELKSHLSKIKDNSNKVTTTQSNTEEKDTSLLPIIGISGISLSSVLKYVRVFINVAISLIGMIPLLITCNILNIDLLYYIPDCIYNLLPNSEYEIYWTGPLFVLSSINLVRRYVKYIITFDKIITFIRKNNYEYIMVFTLIIIFFFII